MRSLVQWVPQVYLRGIVLPVGMSSLGDCFIALCVSLAIFGLGCGYTFQGSQSVLPAGVDSIYIPEVVNRSSDPTVTGLLTEALRERFDRFGVIRVVDDANEADATLKIKVVQLVNTSQTSSAQSDVSQQLNVSMVVSGELIQNSGVVIWKNPVLRTSQAYGNLAGAVVSSSSQFAQSGLGSADINSLNQRELSRSQQDQAIEVLVDTVARQVYEESVAPDF